MEKVSSKNGNGIVDVAPKQLAVRMTEVGKHLDAVDELLADAQMLEDVARRTVVKLRGPEEAVVLQGILQFAAEHEQMFVSLRDQDEGADPTTFETALIAGRLSNAQTLTALAARLKKLHLQVSDAALQATALAKPVALKAYAIAKVMKDGDDINLVTPAINFYRKTSLAGAKTKAEKKAEGAAQNDSAPISATTSSTTK